VVCPMCDQVDESAVHLTLLCTFAKQVWCALATSHAAAADAATTAISTTATKNRTTRSQVMAAMYVAWNLWKERTDASSKMRLSRLRG
jgi:hypothetical protein